MTLKELKDECTSGKWLPILVMRANDNGKPILPMFDTASLAAKFCKRNLPPNWLCGIVDLRLRDAQWMDDNGWKAIKFDYPRKLSDIVEFDVEVVEFEPEHNLVIKI
ncbi:MAG: hypothetical protein M0R50_06940 [Candidatus Cloacimonetes bacterium]|jgi:hypothetical protein|nr:hypothetical protein [Candidatus Cloacimonadota bacterium]